MHIIHTDKTRPFSLLYVRSNFSCSLFAICVFSINTLIFTFQWLTAQSGCQNKTFCIIVDLFCLSHIHRVTMPGSWWQLPHMKQAVRCQTWPTVKEQCYSTQHYHSAEHLFVRVSFHCIGWEFGWPECGYCVFPCHLEWSASLQNSNSSHW